MSKDVFRPIIGIENRTAQEVFDIMCDRFRALQSLSTQQPMGEPVAWSWKDAGGRVKVSHHGEWFENPENIAYLDAKPLYALHPNQESGE